ncbi:MAG: glutaminyl-tRNA synthetase [Bradymonadia bacterium]
MTEEREESGRDNFLSAIIRADLETGKYGRRLVTRFPPEPNGYLHIGHAKSICLNFGLAEQFGGHCHLRFDDTNPLAEEDEYVKAIQEDIAWLGFEWGEHLYFASDYFGVMYDLAVKLINDGKAYVDSVDGETLRELRGSFTEPGRPSEFHSRSVEENLDLFARMRAGEFPDGEHVLRAKIDLSASNMVMRDPLLYRIRKAAHHRTGDAWCIYPMYDYAHCIEDALEGVTHSLCSLEFENNRELYDWMLAETGANPSLHPRNPYGVATTAPPEQREFARLSLENTVMSKRKLRRLVEEGHVDGWNDPRMPTISGLRRRGVRPQAIRAFCDMIGVARTNSLVDYEKFEFCVRDDLNAVAPRTMVVLDPLPVVFTNLPDGWREELDAPLFPEDVPRDDTRLVPITREIVIERSDFALEPPKGWRRLSPGEEVRLRYGYIVRCDEAITNAQGEVIELRCTLDLETRSGDAADGRKVKGTIHWVSATEGKPIAVRLYDRLFTDAQPDALDDFLAAVNPNARVDLPSALAEPYVASLPAGEHVQFERTGFFFTDARPEGIVFNRTVGLRDAWAKRNDAPAPARKAERHEKSEAGFVRPPDTSPERDAIRAQNATLEAAFERLRDELALDVTDADVLTGDVALLAWFDAAAAGADAATIAKWVVNDVVRESKDAPLSELAFGPADLRELVGLVDAGSLSATAAREVFDAMAQGEGSATSVMDARGLKQLDDADALGAIVDDVIADHPDETVRYREGKTSLIGFFVGKAMKASRGAASPAAVRELLMAKLKG